MQQKLFFSYMHYKVNRCRFQLKIVKSVDFCVLIFSHSMKFRYLVIHYAIDNRGGLLDCYCNSVDHRSLPGLANRVFENIR